MTRSDDVRPVRGLDQPARRARRQRHLQPVDPARDLDKQRDHEHTSPDEAPMGEVIGVETGRQLGLVGPQRGTDEVIPPDHSQQHQQRQEGKRYAVRHFVHE